jgi:hypothetical protein
MLKFYIESISSWYPGYDNPQSIPGMLAGIMPEQAAWPKLAFVPAMQRRRLSPFAKIALFAAESATAESATAENVAAECATAENALRQHGIEENAVNHQENQIDIIFSSRHGDLHKTSELLTALADDQDISPTAFSTSVHNAVPGLYSILKHNKQAINALSSGKDSFFYALVDAYARLKSGRCEKLLIVHADRALPELYQQYQDEAQIDHAVAMVVSLNPDRALFDLDCNFEATSDDDCRTQHCSDTNNINKTNNTNNNSDLPAALAFVHWLTGSVTATSMPTAFEFVSDRQRWRCTKNG